MKKTIIASAALALASGIAAAQTNVTFYGIIDAGVLAQNHSAPGRPSVSLASGGDAPSIWGFKGTEDLGGGLKAMFNLEGHFASDTGAQVGNLFRRQANVGLWMANVGAVALGNQYSPAILAFATTDPRGLRENFSGLYSWAYNSGALGGAGINTNNDVGVFLQNAISYTNDFGPVHFGAAVSLSERPTGATALANNTGNHGSVYSLGLTYTGPIALSAAYQQANKPDSGDYLSRMVSLGGAYTMGALTGKLNYLRGTNRAPATLDETSKVDMWGLGVDWKTAPNNTASAAVYFAKDKNNGDDKTTTFILSDQYALSRGTTLYGTLAFANARAGATALTSAVLTPVSPDTNTTLLNVGVKHTF
ncbi:porin [Noviherbaspirillum pedocola]|uniref:Porin n=1 Tax=Noviherbaspirillum pedocola TaxID=2801341 RepID=A0A934T221_9BURK|nr:porin [Noviherbaspirillum pedocola]MBK4737519.1 porin [Noviherbaspirillum pedocola]